MLSILLIAATVLGAAGAEARPALPGKLGEVGWTAPQRLFGPEGPSPDDVYQGNLEDCTLMANLAGLAQQRPQLLAQRVRMMANGRVQVAFPTGTLEFDAALPTVGGKLVFAGDAPLNGAHDPLPARLAGRSSRPSAPLWPAVMERAFATWHGGYLGLNQEIPMPLSELLGWVHIGLGLEKEEPDDAVKLITAALARRAVVVVGNANPALAQARGIRAAHAYTVLGAHADAHGAVQLVLRDPRGVLGAPLVSTGRPGTFELDARDAVKIFRYLSISSDDLSGLPTPRKLTAAK